MSSQPLSSRSSLNREYSPISLQAALGQDNNPTEQAQRTFQRELAGNAHCPEEALGAITLP
jgi:hypothetical protein